LTSDDDRLAAIRDELVPLFPRSLAHAERVGELVPGGTSRARFMFPFPIQVDHGSGSRVWDIDGREYVDGLGAFGPILLGHAHPAIVSAIAEQAARGSMFGMPTPLEAELVGRIVEHVPGAENAVFVASGTEATMAAIRIARAATGREKIAKFTGGWHGWHDYAMPTGPGVPSFIEPSVITLPWDDDAAFDRIRENAADLSCVLVELVLGAAGALPARREFVHGLRELCDELGVLLVVDEVLTGFRFGLGGASAMFDVAGDLVTLGKVVCGGVPGAAVAGRADVLKLAIGASSEESRNRDVAAVLTGTYSAHPLALAAGNAMIAELERHPDLYPRLFALGARLRAGLQTVMDEAGWGVVTGDGPIWGFHALSERPGRDRDLVTATGNHAAAMAMSALLLREGVLVSAPLHLGFLSAAHTDDDVDRIVAAHRTAVSELRTRGFI
jgi:glutamate-1-semialdehyde 2,1-aminomutase